MAIRKYTQDELTAISARARVEFERYRKGPNLDRNGEGRAHNEFSERPRRKTRAQWEREIVGDEIHMNRLKAWSPKHAGRGVEAKRIEPRFSTPAGRDIRVTNAAGVTTINFRVDSLSKTAKRRRASEAWHSATHAKYIERDEAIAELGLTIDPVIGSTYIERAEALASTGDDKFAIYSNISDDAIERQRFWNLVEQHETEGGANELSIDMALAGSIALRVAQDRECPPSLAESILEACSTGTVIFAEGNNVALRSLFERHGWVKPPRGKRRKVDDGAEEPARTGVDLAIRFKDARAGRTQIQANGELPVELSLAGKNRVAEALKDWFDHRGLPVTVVVHSPDHNNNEKNWHFHFAAYDRPCRRFINTMEWLGDPPEDATAQERKAHEKAKAAIERPELSALEGEWDFDVPVTIISKSRNRRTTHPFQQKKDRFVNSDDFIPSMRKLLVQLCNDELERESHPRRYDHRNYPEMGIDKVADEHIDKAANQLEKMGVPTQKGIENEKRQWSFLMRKIDQDYDAGLERIEGIFLRNAAAGQGEADALKSPRVSTWQQWRMLTTSVLQHLRVQQELELLMGRAKSRALKTAAVCRKYIAAIEVGKANKADVASLGLYLQRLAYAEDHLVGVDVRFAEQTKLIDELERSRADLRMAAENLLHTKVLSPAVGAASSLETDDMPGLDNSLTPGKTSALTIALLHDAFRTAKSATERVTAASSIRAYPSALAAMNSANDVEWKAEQSRFNELQRLRSQRGMENEY